MTCHCYPLQATADDKIPIGRVHVEFEGLDSHKISTTCFQDLSFYLQQTVSCFDIWHHTD